MIEETGTLIGIWGNNFGRGNGQGDIYGDGEGHGLAHEVANPAGQIPLTSSDLDDWICWDAEQALR